MLGLISLKILLNMFLLTRVKMVTFLLYFKKQLGGFFFTEKKKVILVSDNEDFQRRLACESA